MKSKWKGRLGVSTVIANLLMIMITLSLAAILVAWAGASYGAFSGGTQLFFVQRGQALQERFAVENVFFNKTQNRILLFVRNIGVEEIKVVAIYVNGTILTPTGSSGTCQYSGSPPSVTLTVGAVCEFNLNWGSTPCSPNHCPWITGDLLYIIVASARGNQASYTARGP